MKFLGLVTVYACYIILEFSSARRHDVAVFGTTLDPKFVRKVGKGWFKSDINNLKKLNNKKN